MVLAAALGGASMLAAPAAMASVTRFDSLNLDCESSCVDTWKVVCKSSQTHSVWARVKDEDGSVSRLVVTALATKGPATLVGRADAEAGGANLSPLAEVTRPGTSHARTEALVTVIVGQPPVESDYRIDFGCVNVDGVEVGNPEVKRLQNDRPLNGG
jgi:hypothetical protein